MPDTNQIEQAVAEQLRDVTNRLEQATRDLTVAALINHTPLSPHASMYLALRLRNVSHQLSVCADMLQPAPTQNRAGATSV